MLLVKAETYTDHNGVVRHPRTWVITYKDGSTREITAHLIQPRGGNDGPVVFAFHIAYEGAIYYISADAFLTIEEVEYAPTVEAGGEGSNDS